MTIDLTSAGTRGLQTLDSIADLQNVLKILNFKPDLLGLRTNLAASAASLSAVETFIKNNPYIDAEILRGPVNNGLYGPHDVAVEPGPADMYSRFSLSDPLAFSKLKATDSRIFSSSFEPIYPAFYASKRRELRIDFI